MFDDILTVEAMDENETEIRNREHIVTSTQEKYKSIRI